MRIISKLNFAVLTLILAGCAAINMNHYQDGKSLGKGKSDASFGVGSGLFFETDTTRLDEDDYEIRTKMRESALFLSVAGRVGVTSKFDFGGEIFTTLGSSGFKVFGKYAFTDSLSRWGVALMPIFGFSFPWFEDDEGANFSTDEISFFARSLILEFMLPASYHPSSNLAITFGPKLYWHHNYIFQTSGRSVDFHRKGVGTYFSPAGFIGLHFKKFRFETSIVYRDKKVWTPFVGINVSSSKIISLF
ncbi:hypothetical protein L0Z72_02980 [candidate division KSB1 bacterium]|nr:hypothetical protein [candidate division KSB1 bacterium]